ncbi:MAG: hypothetical protein ACSHYB_13810 [Roseibacillus sp.]
MMILLSLIAVGLLSLSSSVLRGAQNGASMAEARANARLALNLAIGELQKQAGPDTRVTARADILNDPETNTVANPYLTGVWESWYMDPNTSLNSGNFSESEKEAKLLTWLASGAPNREEVTNNFVKQSLRDEVTLWGAGSLGSRATDREKVKASLMTLSEERGAGGYAWAVLDEGVKARVNTLTHLRNDNSSASVKTEKMSQLGAGVRPSIESISGLDGFQANSFLSGTEGNPNTLPEDGKTLAKAVTYGNFGLVAEQLAGIDSEDLKEHYHDISLFSSGLLTDTARGGLKTDFSLFSSETTLPQLYSHEEGGFIDLATKGVYDTLLGIGGALATSSPRWNSLYQFSRLHEDGVEIREDAPLVQAAVPSGWAAARASRGGFRLNKETPDDLVLMPTIANVQMIFSLVGRDLYNQSSYPPGSPPTTLPRSASNLHNPQAGHFRTTKFHFDLHLMYTPVVVLHNPYSVALEFEDIKINFHHIPFAMKVIRNGEDQSTGLVPFESMFADNDNESKDKVFGMKLRTERRGRVGNSTFQMLPGEVILFSPYLNPQTTYQSNFSGGRVNWDIYVGDNKTAELEAIPGWRGDGMGFSCDWLAGAKRVDGVAASGRWSSCFGLAHDDEISVEFAPFTKDTSDNKFLVTMSATPKGQSSESVVNAIEIDYESPEKLRERILGSSNGTLRYPEEDTIAGRDLIDWAGTPIGEMVNVKPFAVVSLQAKTTYAAENPDEFSPVDGRIASKPWSFAHGSIGVASANLSTEHPSSHSHELDIKPLTAEGTEAIIEVGANNRGNFITGHSSQNGSKFGVAYEIPLTPLQSLPTLNGANPGGVSAFLPRFAAPIGNSWAHPLLSPDTVEERAAEGYDMYDHSFLMNVAFYDRFYFSGLGSRTGPYGDGRSSSEAIQRFIQDGSLGDQRLSLYQPDSRATSELQALATNSSGHEEVAAWQIMNGAFNINSTSVDAWKAMLTSIYAPDAQLNELSPDGEGSSEITNLNGSLTANRISRFRVPLSRSLEEGGPEKTSFWLGPREYTDAQIETLAQNIVEEIKDRGPFLSIAEFVNRQLGPTNEDRAQMGALQAAIDEAKLNDQLVDDSNAGFDIEVDSVAGYEYKNTKAAEGSSAQGAPGYLTQADLLSVLGNATTARSDTFTVRGYGESRDNSGRIEATAVCEAVVQRFPEWMDSVDEVEERPVDLKSETNQKFGRRFRMVSFRWLSESEV